MSNHARLAHQLVSIGACRTAVRWVRSLRKNGKPATFCVAWRVCEERDWMVWLLGVVLPLETDEGETLSFDGCACAYCRARGLSPAEIRQEWPAARIKPLLDDLYNKLH